MSTTIDQRVVEMQFDNKHFESNVSTTMSTLDKLKQKLHLDGATKGLENVNHAAKNVNMSALGSAVETVQAKFSAMQVIGVTALANITNSAVNAGKRMVSALTIDPVKTGLQEYETQINATQTILANTASKGSDINDVNKALEELNAYADKTIYNFTEMTRNIGTFTAAGIDLDTSVNAIQGIANLAAVSGSTSQQASTAMYQLSQALASGTVKLMDWNSVVNAGMGGEMFQNALKETSELLGTGAEAAIKAEGSFRESLKNGWLTSEVLTETLKKFTTTGANERVAEYTGLSKEAVEAALKEAEASAEAAKAKGKEVDAIELAAEALAKKSGKNKKEIQDTLQFARTAEDAATKVKTFSQLWDVLKESAQSGWSQSWKIIIGDFEQAKELLTPLADFLTGFVNKMSDARNRVLQIALGFAKPWTAISDKIAKITGTVNKVTEAVSDALKPLEYFQDVVDRVWMGEFNNQGDNPDRRDLLKAAGYDPRVVQYLVNLGEEAWHSGKVYKLSMEEVEAAHKKYGLTVQNTKEETEKVTTAFNDLSDAQLKEAGLTEEEIRLYRALEKEADRAGISINELAKEMSENDGRSLLIESFKNIADVFIGVGKAAKKAWNDIFNPPSNEEMGIRLYGIIRSLKEFTEKLRLTDEKTGELNETGKKIQRTLKGVFAAIDIILTVLGGPIKIVFKLLTQLLSAFGFDVLDVTASIGDVIVKFRDWIDSSLDFTKVFEKLVPIVKKAVAYIGNLFDRIKKTEAFKQFTKTIQNIGSAIKKWFSNIDMVDVLNKVIPVIKKVASFVGKLIDKVKESGVFKQFISYLKDTGSAFIDWVKGIKDADNIPLYIIKGLINGLKSGIGAVGKVVFELGKAILEFICSSLGIHSPSTEFFDIGWNCIQGLINGFAAGLAPIIDFCKTLISKVVNFITEADFGTLLGTAVSGGLIISGIKLADAIHSFAAPLSGLGDMFEEFGDAAKAMGKGVKNYLNSKALLNLAIAIGVLVASLVVLTFIKPEKMWHAVGALAALAGVVAILGGVAIAINKLGDFKAVATTLLSITGAIFIMALVLKTLSDIDTEKANTAVSLLTNVLFGMVVMVVTVGLLSKIASADAIDSTGTMLIKMAVAMYLMVHVIKVAAKLDESTVWKGIGVVAAIELLFLAAIAVSWLAGEHASKAGGMLLKMSIAMLIMLASVKIASMMSEETVRKGLGVVAAIELLFLAVIAVSWLAGEHASKAGGMLLKMSIAMLIMLAVIKLASVISEDEVARASGVMALIGGLFLAFMLVSRIAGDNASEVGKMLIKLSVALLILAGVMFIFSLFTPTALAKGLIAISILIGCITGLVAVTKIAKGTKGMAKTLTLLLVAIGMLAAIVIGMSFIDPARLAIATGAMSMLMGMFALLIGITKVAKNTKDTRKTLILMLGVVVVLAGVVAALSFIPNPESAIASCTALSILLAAFASSLFILSKAGKISKTVSKQIFPMLLVVAGLAAILGIMSYLDVEASIPSAIALGILLNALASSLVIMGTAGKISSTVSKQLLPMLLVVGGLALVMGLMAGFDVEASIPSAIALGILLNAIASALVIMGTAGKISSTVSKQLLPMLLVVGGLALIMGLMAGFEVEASISSAIALGVLLNAMAAAMVILSKAGKVSMASVGAMAVMGLVVGELVLIIGLLREFGLDIELSIGTALALSTLLIGMSAALTILSVVGTMGPAVFVGIGALATLIAGLGLIVVALGGLAKAMPELESFLDSGIPILEKLGAAIGSFLGNIIGGFLDGITDGLPGIAMDLSIFMLLLQPFIHGAKQIDAKMMEGVGSLAGIILTLTAANILDGIASWITGGSSIADFAKDLVPFGLGLVAFAETVKGLDSDAVAAAANAGSMMASMAGNIPNSGGVLGFIMGENDIDKFGQMLPKFGLGLVAFSNVVKGRVDAEAVEVAANAGSMMAAMAGNIPNSGGVLGFIMGENDIDKFGAKLPVFGLGLAMFSSVVKGRVDAEAVEVAVNAGSMLASLAGDIPNSGGVVGFIMGENDIDKFGAKLPVFGLGLAMFSNVVKGRVDEDAVAVAANAGSMLAAMAGDIPNSGGVMGFILGENDIDKFGAKLPVFGLGISNFCDAIGDNVTTDKAEAAAAAAEVLIGLSKQLPNTGGVLGWLQGDQDLSHFGSQLKDFGKGIAGFAEAVEGIDPATTESAAIAGKTLAEMAGGLAAATVLASMNGVNFDAFGTSMASYGSAMKTFSTACKGIVLGDIWLGRDASDAITSMTDPSTIVASITAFTDSAAFKTNLYNFGWALATYTTAAKAMDTVAITDSASAIKSLVDANIPSLINNFGTYSNSIYWFNYNLESLVKALKKYGDDIKTVDVAGMKANTAEVSNAVKAISKMVDTDTTNIKTFSKSLGDFGASGVDAFINSFAGASSKVYNAGADMVAKFLNGAKSKNESLKTAFEAIASACASALDNRTAFYNAGSNLVSSFASGISENDYKAEAKARAMAKAAVEAAKDELDINSPSKVFRKIGTSVPEGFAMGIDKLSSMVTDSSRSMGQVAIDNVQSTIRRLAESVNTDIDSQPTIRPVLDLTNVRAGAGSISSLLNTGSSVGVIADVGRVSAMMNGYSQNGVNAEVVSAINKLRKDMGNVGNTTYSINGISVSEGTDAAEAIHALIRTIKMEGRT